MDNALAAVDNDDLSVTFTNNAENSNAVHVLRCGGKPADNVLVFGMILDPVNRSGLLDGGHARVCPPADGADMDGRFVNRSGEKLTEHDELVVTISDAFPGMAVVGSGQPILAVGMAIRLSYCLRFQDHTASGTVRSLSLAGRSAGRRNSGIGYNGVLRCWDVLLCCEDGVADGAMSAFGLAGGGAGRGNFIINNARMSGRRNSLLCDPCVSSKFAFFTFCEARI